MGLKEPSDPSSSSTEAERGGMALLSAPARLDMPPFYTSGLPPSTTRAAPDLIETDRLRLGVVLGCVRGNRPFALATQAKKRGAKINGAASARRGATWLPCLGEGIGLRTRR